MSLAVLPIKLGENLSAPCADGNTFQAFPFSLCGTGTELLQMPAHKDMPSSQRRKWQCHHRGKWQGTILLNVRKNTLSPSVVEERTHEYLNEKCGVRGKKEISLGLHCNTSSEEDHRHALLADLIFGNVWFLVHAGSRRSTSLRLRTWAEDSNTELHPLTGGKLPKSPVLLWRQERAKSQSQKEQDTFSVAV